METEKLQFNKIEEEVGEDFSDLKEVDHEQATEVGFQTVEGTAAWNEDKFEGPINQEDDTTLNLTYTFEKPILFQGYMLQTADDNADWDPKNWRVVNESGEVVHTVEDESPKERLEEKKYRLDGDGVWTNQI